MDTDTIEEIDNDKLMEEILNKPQETAEDEIPNTEIPLEPIELENGVLSEEVSPAARAAILKYKDNPETYIKGIVNRYANDRKIALNSGISSVILIENLIVIQELLVCLDNITTYTPEGFKELVEKDKKFIYDILYEKNTLVVLNDIRNNLFKQENTLLLNYIIKDRLKDIFEIVNRYLVMLPVRRSQKHWSSVAGFGAARAEQYEEEELEKSRNMGDAKEFIVKPDGEILPHEEA